MLGDIDRGARSLDEAVQAQPNDASLHSDLSAALIALGLRDHSGENLIRAVAEAARALRLEPKRSEALFNQAMALQALHLDDEAIATWSAFQAADRSAWISEAQAEAQAARLRLTNGRLAAADLQPRRETIEDEYLAHWGEAFLSGERASATRWLERAEVEALDLVRNQGDAMPAYAVADVRRAAATSRPDRLESLARGHQLYGDARRLFLADRLKQAADTMSQAATFFGRARSPYQAWGPIYRAIVGRLNSPADSLRELATVRSESWPDSFSHLRGRFAWTEGVTLGTLGRLDVARNTMAQAVAAFRGAHEMENLSATETYLAELDWYLGSRRLAWNSELDALGHLNGLRVSVRRNFLLLKAASFSLSDGLPEAALHFQNALVRSVESANAQLGRVDAYLERAKTLSRLGRRAEALGDLTRAETAVAAVRDEGLHARGIADVAILRGEITGRQDPARALQDIGYGIAYYSGQATRLPRLLMLSATLREALGDVTGAARDFGAADDAFVRDRAQVSSSVGRMRAFDEERAVLQEYVRFAAITRHDPTAALEIAERGRATGAAERWTEAPRAAVNPSSARHELPDDVAVVYFAVLRDRVLVWVLTHDSEEYFERAGTSAALTTIASRIQREVAAGASAVTVSSTCRWVIDELLVPALRRVKPGSRLVLVPDGPLHAVPFAALLVEAQRPLVARHPLVVAPSLTTFLAATRRLASTTVEDVLALGDGHDPSDTRVPRLAFADDEAAAVGLLYQRATVRTGAMATRYELLQAHSSVVHFAGHTLIDAQFPFFSRLLLGRDRRDDTGDLLASDIASSRFDRTRLVVLGSCEGAAGPFVEGEGPISVAQMFFMAGVPTVVASLWPIDDRTHGLFTMFHQEYVKSGDAATALRASQLGLLEREGMQIPARLWAGLVTLGGFTPGRAH